MKIRGELYFFSFLIATISLMFEQFAHGRDPHFHVPYACSIMYDFGIQGKDSVLISAGSILDRDIVIVTVDSLNNLIDATSLDYFYNHVDRISVHAGTNFMDPRKITTRQIYAQSKNVKNLYVPYKPTFDDPSKVFWKNPENLSLLEHDVFGVAFNIGFLQILGKFSFSPFVLPIFVTGGTVTELKTLTIREIEFQENLNMSTERCLTYSYNAALNKIRYHEVTYLPKNNCVDIYCMYRVSNCTLFPRYEHLSCYKSTTYVDVCPEARGAALYCDLFDKSVIGILTFAPLCGQRNTPGVYTSLALVMEFYEKVFSVSFLPARTKYSLDKIAKQQAA